MKILWFTVPKALGVTVYTVIGALVIARGAVATIPQVRVPVTNALPIMRDLPALGLAAGVTYQVEGDSMTPTYQSGENVTLLPLTGDRPQACDIIALRAPSGGVWLKRVVAVGPATVIWTAGSVTVNGAPACPSHIHSVAAGAPETFALQAGLYFVAGDNLLNSEDSRMIGPVARASITGYLPG